MLSSFFKRLLMGRQLEFAEGDIEILETKFSMHSLNHYYYWREYNKQKRGSAGLAEIYDIGKQTGREISKNYKEKFKLEGLESANFWKNLIELTGFAKVKMIDPKEGGKVLIQLESSFAKHYTDRKQKTQENVDEYLTGLLTGVFEEMYSRELSGEETKCSTSGSPFCEIVIKPKK